LTQRWIPRVFSPIAISKQDFISRVRRKRGRRKKLVRAGEVGKRHQQGLSLCRRSVNPQLKLEASSDGGKLLGKAIITLGSACLAAQRTRFPGEAQRGEFVIARVIWAKTNEHRKNDDNQKVKRQVGRRGAIVFGRGKTF